MNSVHNFFVYRIVNVSSMNGVKAFDELSEENKAHFRAIKTEEDINLLLKDFIEWVCIDIDIQLCMHPTRLKTKTNMQYSKCPNLSWPGKSSLRWQGHFKFAKGTSIGKFESLSETFEGTPRPRPGATEPRPLCSSRPAIPRKCHHTGTQEKLQDNFILLLERENSDSCKERAKIQSRIGVFHFTNFTLLNYSSWIMCSI